MPSAHFTDAWVRTVTVTTRTDFFDDVTAGFVLRVSPTGAKTWGLFYRNARQKARRYRLGTVGTMTLGEARKAAREALLALAAAGTDPAEQKQERRRALTFDLLADLFIEQYAKPRKRTWRADARQLRVFCRPRWEHRSADGVDRADVRTLLAEVATTRGGTTANRLRACLSKLFRWAVAQGHLEQNPAAGLPAPAGEQTRERLLSDDEIKKLWQELDEASNRRDEDAKYISPTVAFWLKLRLLTAQRGGEVSAMQWAHVDLAAGLWELPAALMKSKRPHVVPLAPWVVELLREWRRGQAPTARYVLAGGRARRIQRGVTGRIESVRDWTPHDLRRTAATGMARLGASRFVVGRVLGHADPSVTGIYDRFEYFEEKQAALKQWAEHVGAVIGVVGVRPARRGRLVRMPARGRR